MATYNYIMWLGEIHNILLTKYNYQIAELFAENPKMGKKFKPIFENAYIEHIALQPAAGKLEQVRVARVALPYRIAGHLGQILPGEATVV